MASSDEPRTPLGLPEGSVRAVLALQIMLSFWLMMILPDPEVGGETKKLHIPLNLYFLLAFPFMFFVSYRRSMSDGSVDEPSPLGLPPILIKLLILVGTAAVIGYQSYYNLDRLKERLTPDQDTLQNAYLFAGALFGGFFLGFIIRALPGRNSPIFQFIHAWLSMIAVFALLIEIVVHAFVEPSLENKIDITALEVAITAIVATYFGTRS